MSPWAKFFVTLFFGMFGIHKFAEREIGPGLAYLFTAGLFGVGWLYDTVCSLAAALQSSGHSSAPAANKSATVQSAAPAVQAPLKPKTLTDNSKARKAYLQERQRQFSAQLDALERVPIGTDGRKGTIRMLDVDDLHFSTVTTRSKLSNLGNYVAIDIETSGLRVTMPILEVSAVRFDDFQPVAAYTTLIDPGKPIPSEATQVNGITDDMVCGCPTIWQIVPSLNAFVGGRPIVGHNLRFDLRFLYRYGFDIAEKQKLFDTLILGRRIVPRSDTENYKLVSLCGYYGIDYFGAHRSLADAYVTGQLFELLAKERTSIE